MTQLAIITTCHGREHHLTRTLRQNTSVAPVLVVDGLGGDPNYSQCRKLCDEYGATWVPSPSTYFHKTRLQNIGALNAWQVHQAEWLAFVDSDVELTGDRWYQNGERDWLKPGEFYIGPKGTPDLTGFLLVHNYDFHHAGGFDLAIRDWGGEDWEMRLRLYVMLRVQPVRLGANCFRHINHTDEARIKNHRRLTDEQCLTAEQWKAMSLERNANYIHHKLGLSLNDLKPFEYEDVLDLMEMSKRSVNHLDKLDQPVDEGSDNGATSG